jgi:hypothetical protein
VTTPQHRRLCSSDGTKISDPEDRFMVNRTVGRHETVAELFCRKKCQHRERMTYTNVNNVRIIIALLQLEGIFNKKRKGTLRDGDPNNFLHCESYSRPVAESQCKQACLVSFLCMCLRSPLRPP